MAKIAYGHKVFVDRDGLEIGRAVLYIRAHCDNRRERYLEPWARCSLCFSWLLASTAFVTRRDHFPRKGDRSAKTV
jgi:hypothetical protein